MQREVTEQDFRMPEYRNAKPEDYEWRADGKLVRKDRWEQGIQSIRFLVGIDAREFEIPEVVDRVRGLASVREAVVAYLEAWDHYEAGSPERVETYQRLCEALNATARTDD